MVTSLAVFFMHGSIVDLKVASKPVIANPSVLTIGVYYNLSGPIVIIGCNRITELLATKESWFNDDLSGHLNIFKQLFDKVMGDYLFTSNQIYFFAEGNFGCIAGQHLTSTVLEWIDYTKPGTAVLPTGTPECCKFINYWREYHRYPSLELSESFFSETNYYSVEELDAEKTEKLHSMLGDMLLNCSPPRIATFDKKLTGESARYLIEKHSVLACSTGPNKAANHKVDEHLLSAGDEGDNNVYAFQAEEGDVSGESLVEQIPHFDIATKSKPSVSFDSTDPSSSRTASISVTFRANQDKFLPTDKAATNYIDDRRRLGSALFRPSVSPSPEDVYRFPQHNATDGSQLELARELDDAKVTTQRKKSTGFKLFWCCQSNDSVVIPSSRPAALQVRAQGDGSQNFERMEFETKLGV